MPPRSDTAATTGPQTPAGASTPPGPAAVGPGSPAPAAGQVSRLPVQLPRVPWSVVGPEFISLWGYPGGKFDPEHVEILGPTGSGKTHLEVTILQWRARARDSAIVFFATKQLDKTIGKLGFETVNTWKGVQDNRQCVYWPRTKLLGRARHAYMAAKIDDILGRLWSAGSTIVAFDEIASLEEFSPELKGTIKMYWREARSQGITIVAMKQRPQGVQRDMHSESSWMACFRPKDEDDAKRYAEILGGRRGWSPVLMSLDRQKHEFILKHEVSGQAVITWIDTPLVPMREPRPYEKR